MIFESDIERLRDPFILLDKGVYYAYGTGWICYKNESGRLDRGWEYVGEVVEVPSDFEKHSWAPEVYAVNGKYYMFTTYFSSATGHRGCSTFCADSPIGPFKEISDGHFTPKNIDAIDATLFFEDGVPYTVFVHEWTCTDDGIGRMAVARMSDDLTRLVSKPREIFRADSPVWTNERVTDGPYLTRLSEGTLLMIWSNFAKDGYSVGVAISVSGKVDGEWIQEEQRLFYKGVASGAYDGGHGMIFTALDGKQYLSVHSPNSSADGRPEKPIFIPICEKNGTLALDV